MYPIFFSFIFQKYRRKAGKKHRVSRKSAESSFSKESENLATKDSSSKESFTLSKESETFAKEGGSSSRESETLSNVSDMQENSSCQTDDKLMGGNKESQNESAIDIGNETMNRKTSDETKNTELRKK